MPAETGLDLFWTTALLLVPVLYAGSLAWVYRDAGRRRHRPWMAVAFVMVAGWPLSLFVWLVIRSGRALAPRGFGTAWG